MTTGEFSVAVFYPNGYHEYVKRWVSAEKAFEVFRLHCIGPAAKAGLVTKVIITDGGDCTNMEWKHGEGLTYPTDEDMPGIKEKFDGAG